MLQTRFGGMYEAWHLSVMSSWSMNCTIQPCSRVQDSFGRTATEISHKNRENFKPLLKFPTFVGFDCRNR